MSTQQDIYDAGFKNRHPMLNKEKYVPWSSRLLRYAKSGPNEKLIYNSIINGPYVRRMIPEPGDQNREDLNVRNQNGLIVVLGIANLNSNGNGNVVAARAKGNAIMNNSNQIRCYNCRGLDRLARNYTVRPRRMDQASTSGTQTDKASVYDSNGSAEVHNYDNFYVNEIFNMSTQEDKYTELLEPIPKPHQVQQNDSNVVFEVSSVEQDGGTVDQHPKMTLGYQNLFYLKQAQQKQQSLYNGKVLLEKHDPPVVYDLEDKLELAQESRLKMKQSNKEIKPANYTKINHLSRYPFDYRVTLGFGSITGGLDPVSRVIRLPIERGINSGTRIDKIMVGINIDDLTIKQYLRLTSENQTPSIVKKVDDMTINEYMEYEERMKGNISNIKFNYDLEDMELDEEVRDMPANLREMIILGRPFLETVHAQIDVFQEEISLGIGKDRIKFGINRNLRSSNRTIEKVYMANTSQEEESFNPLRIGHDLFSYKSPTCL
nr:hypothetical protein [Tanacetum cinerariifolium]